MKRRSILIALAALILAALWLSQQSAQRFVPAVESAIERGLGRPVEINGEAHFLPWRLGFSLTEVVIHDEPRFGLEPLAYVKELQATIRLTALLQGRLEFNRLHLIAPSVNLAQSAAGWNFPALLDQALSRSSDNAAAPPQVEVTGGRLNVRFGETKSVYYLWDANLTIEPGSRADQLSVYFDGVPARTDRGIKGFGRLSARGNIGLAGKREVALQAALERSAASELLLLFQDRGSSVTGFFSGNATLKGPLEALQIDGRLQLHEFQRWAWLTGAGRGPAIDWGGVLNWERETVHLNTKPASLPVGVSVDGSRLLGAAEWQSNIDIRDTPAEALETLAQEFGFALPGRMALAGKLNGGVHYATNAGLDGKIDFSGGSLSLPSKETAEVEPTSLRFAGRNATLDPVIIRQGPDVVRLEAAYGWDAIGGGLSWAFSGPELDLGRAREWGMALPGRVQSGKWRGNLRYEAASGGWRGEGDLLDASIDVEGLSAIVHLDSARVRLQGAQFSLNRMTGRVDDLDFRGDFQYDPAATVQSQLQLQVGELRLDALPGWLSQAVDRPTGVFSRTLGLAATAPPPDWVEGRRMNAQLQMKALRVGSQIISGPISARLAWSKGALELANFAGPGRLRGNGQLVLAGTPPAPGKFSFDGIPWHGGLAQATFEFDALGSLHRGKFTITARDVSLLQTERWSQVTAAGEFEAKASGPGLTFTSVEVLPTPGNSTNRITGTGQSREDGSWEWSLLAPPSAQRKISGPVFDGFWKENP